MSEASLTSLELQSKISEWRQKAREGILTPEEMKQAVVYLRANRVAASAPVSKKQVVNEASLLSELGL